MEELKKQYTDINSRSIAALTVIVWASTLVYFSECIINISL